MKKAPKQANKYPTSFQTVDIVLRNADDRTVLLGRKKNKRKWRFPGGFVDPEKDQSLEGAAFREMNEECDGLHTLTTGPCMYVFSLRVDDERYRDSNDKILTAVHVVDFLGGAPKAGDDLAAVKWYSVAELSLNYKKFVVPEHWPIVERLLKERLLDV